MIISRIQKSFILMLIILPCDGNASVQVIGKRKDYVAVFNEYGRILCAVATPIQTYSKATVVECARFCKNTMDCVAFNVYNDMTCELMACYSNGQFSSVDSCRVFTVNNYILEICCLKTTNLVVQICIYRVSLKN